MVEVEHNNRCELKFLFRTYKVLEALTLLGMSDPEVTTFAELTNTLTTFALSSDFNEVRMDAGEAPLFA